MGCCRDFAEKFLMLFSVLTLIFSLVVLGFAGFLFNQLGDEFNELDLNSPVIVTVIFGAALLVFSAIGLFGACKDWKCALFIYLIGCIVLAIGIIASGAALLAQSGALENVEQLEVVDGELEALIYDFELAVFVNCCEDNTDFQVCEVVDGRAVIDAFDCFINQNAFDGFNNFLGGADATTCQTLANFEDSAGRPFVSEEPDTCDELAETFINELNLLIEDNLVQLATANIVAGVVMLLLMCSTCYLLCTTSDEKKK